MAKDIDVTLSTRYKKEIKQALDKILGKRGNLGIDHFAVSAILPINNKVIVISSNRYLSEKLNAAKWGRYDTALDENFCKNFTIWPWRFGNQTTKSSAIHKIRETEFKIKSGTNFCRKIGDFYVVYGIGSYNEDPIMELIFRENVNKILEVGDEVYNFHLHRILQDNSLNCELPLIDRFIPFAGGLKDLYPSCGFDIKNNKIRNRKPVLIYTNQNIITNKTKLQKNASHLKILTNEKLLNNPQLLRI